MEKEPFRGAFGTFPDGKVNATDEGALQLTIDRKGDKVMVDFGTSVHWLVLSPKQAMTFAAMLFKKARSCWQEWRYYEMTE